MAAIVENPANTNTEKNKEKSIPQEGLFALRGLVISMALAYF